MICTSTNKTHNSIKAFRNDCNQPSFIYTANLVPDISLKIQNAIEGFGTQFQQISLNYLWPRSNRRQETTLGRPWTVKTRIECTSLFRVRRSHKRRKMSGKEGLPIRLMSKTNSKQRKGAIMHFIPRRSLLMTTTTT
jgi:hypothetical protein